MAGDEERLVTIFEARLTDFERRMRDSVRTTQRTRQQIERESAALAKKMEADMAKAGGGFGNALGMVRGALGAAGIGLGGRAIVQMTSDWTDLNARVVNAVGSMDQGAETMDRLSEMARRTYSSFSQTTESFLQNATALTELGYSTTQQLDLTEALNNALVISAARGQQADSVMRAWSQAMALGQLSGQNLNTVLQSGDRLAKALADSMGVGTNELRRLGSEGRITTDVMYGVTGQLETLRAEADAMPATLADSFVLLGNSVFKFVGQADQAMGATAKFADEIIRLSDAIDRHAGPAIDVLGALGDAYARLSDGPEGRVLGTGSITGPGYLLDLLGEMDDLSEVSAENLEKLQDRAAAARVEVIELAAELVAMEDLRAIAPELPGQIEEIIDKLLLGQISAQDAETALRALDTVNFRFEGLINQLAGLVGEMRTVTAAANEMNAALDAPVGRSAGMGDDPQGRRRHMEAREAMGEHIGERERILSLTGDQLTLEQAITREKQLAAQAGVDLGDAEAERLARLQIAQRKANQTTGGRRSGSVSAMERFENEMEAMRQRTPLLQVEFALQAMINTSLEAV